jgi:undecaprenyl diphosphate synthase
VTASTKAYTEGQLLLALSYGGRVEIARAARLIAEEVKAGRVEPEQVDEAMVAAHLYAPDVPDPDLLIRTSGEMRISNFLLWQISYAELYVTPTLWPDFGEAEFEAALADYERRQRRYGDIG